MPNDFVLWPAKIEFGFGRLFNFKIIPSEKSKWFFCLFKKF